MKGPFGPAKGQVKRLFESTMVDVLARIEQALGGETRDVVRAVVLGGSIAAGASMISVEPLARLRRKLDKDNATAVVKVFALAMLSRWLVRQDRQGQSAHEMRQRRESWGELLLHLFGDDTAESLAHFLDTDVQYLYELRASLEGRVCAVSYSMLMVDCISELTGRHPIQGAQGQFPFETHRDLWGRPGVTLDKTLMGDLARDFGQTVKLRAILERAWQSVVESLQQEGRAP
jgi:hypothetical protein